MAKKKKPALMRELMAEAKNYSGEQLEAMLAQIDEAIDQWSKMKMLYAIYRIELNLGLRTHTPKDLHRTKGAVGASAYDKAVRDLVDDLGPRVMADPNTSRKEAVNRAVEADPILCPPPLPPLDKGASPTEIASHRELKAARDKLINKATRAILRRLPPKNKAN